MQKTNYEKALCIAAVVSFILFALLGSIHFWCFNESFYTSEHNKLTLYGKSIADHIGISDEDLKDLTHFTLSYLNDPDASLEREMIIKGELREVFTDDEKLHMEDVRDLNLIANRLILISAVIFIASMILIVIRKYSFSLLFDTYRRVLVYISVFLGVVGSWILIDFDSFWTFFHHIFFAGNDLWLLDLRKDVLIMIVPPDFFNHLVITIVVTFVVLLVIAYMVLRSLSRKGEAR